MKDVRVMLLGTGQEGRLTNMAMRFNAICSLQPSSHGLRVRIEWTNRQTIDLELCLAQFGDIKIC